MSSYYLLIHCVFGPGAERNGSTLLFSREEGRGRRKQCVVGARGRASHMRPVTVAHCFFQGKREEGGESSAWLARVGAPRTALLPCAP